MAVKSAPLVFTHRSYSTVTEEILKAHALLDSIISHIMAPKVKSKFCLGYPISWQVQVSLSQLFAFGRRTISLLRAHSRFSRSFDSRLLTGKCRFRTHSLLQQILAIEQVLACHRMNLLTVFGS